MRKNLIGKFDLDGEVTNEDLKNRLRLIALAFIIISTLMLVLEYIYANKVPFIHD